MSRPETARAVIVSTVVLLVVAVPGVWMAVAGSSAPDGFPASTYPMFTRDRGRIVELPTVVAVAPGGRVERLSPGTIAGTDQVIQAAVTVAEAVDGGPGPARDLCREVAGRLPGSVAGSPARPGTEVAVVIERHDAVAWAGDHGTEPLQRRVVARCEVPG